MLPKPNRLRAGSDFNLITKTGARFSSPNLVLYANLAKTDQPKIGFIVNRSVGGSVTRHLVTRKLRHNFASHIQILPNNLMIVVRVLKSQNDYSSEVNQLIEKAILEFGLKGLLMGVYRFIRCNPFSQGGVDYPSTNSISVIKERQLV